MSEDHEAPPEPATREELFIAFANTLEYDKGEPLDRLANSEALTDWLYAHGLLNDRERAAERRRLRADPRWAERQLDRFRQLRSLTHRIADRTTSGRRPSAAQVREINEALRDGPHYHRLEPVGDGARYTVTQMGDRIDQARATIAGSLAHFLADHDPDRLRTCSSETCRWLFVDTSPSGRRRWCDMRVCGNRVKVARHRARRRRAQAAPRDPGERRSRSGSTRSVQWRRPAS